MNYIDFAKKKGSIKTGKDPTNGEYTEIERKGQTTRIYRNPTKGYVITGTGDGNDKKAWNIKQARKAANYYSSHPYATMKDIEKHAGGKKKKDKGAWEAAMYEPSIPVDDSFGRRDGFFRAADGSWKVGNIVGVGLPAAAAAAALIKLGVDKYKTRNDAKKVSSFSEDNYMNYSGNLDDIFIGNDGVAIVGDGAAEALFSTLGDLTKYAENNDSLISAGVDAIRAAQFSKLENHEYFGETDSVSLDECPYRVGDTLEVAPNFGGTVVEVMPLPESFCDDTVSSQIRLDNGAICNVTPSGSIWLEMSENGDFVTTPLIKYNNIRVGDEVFSTYDLGLVADEEDANFGIEDYISEQGENFDYYNPGTGEKVVSKHWWQSGAGYDASKTLNQGRGTYGSAGSTPNSYVQTNTKPPVKHDGGISRLKFWSEPNSMTDSGENFNSLNPQIGGVNKPNLTGMSSNTGIKPTVSGTPGTIVDSYPRPQPPQQYGASEEFNAFTDFISGQNNRPGRNYNLGTGNTGKDISNTLNRLNNHSEEFNALGGQPQSPNPAGKRWQPIANSGGTIVTNPRPQPLMNNMSEDYISNDYKTGVALVEQSSNFSEEDIASFSNAYGLDFSEVAQGYVDAINYVNDMQNVETTNFSAPQIDPGRVTNFSAQDYNNTLSEISSWTTDLTI